MRLVDLFLFYTIVVRKEGGREGGREARRGKKGMKKKERNSENTEKINIFCNDFIMFLFIGNTSKLPA